MEFTKHESGGILYFTSPLFDRYEIPHMFASRFGGVSKGDFFSLNVSSSRKNAQGQTDSADNISENFLRALMLLGRDLSCASMMKQIHSSDVQIAETSAQKVFSCGGDFQACDGIFAGKGQEISALCAKSADCVPILVYDVKNNAACAVHAGWRGTVAGICENAVHALRENFGEGKIVAAIGPCIQSCCYEVNDTVYSAAHENANRLGLSKKSVDSCFTERYECNGESKYKVSLPSLNALYLENAGVKTENISICEMCTCCHKENGKSIFFSHRASGGYSGTQMSIVAVK